ncbi:molybdenum cofactor guanylyltransferase [Allonocardiopsis opalescens]|uniref:Molybdopterin-guanine dinucleotide biosynthesis protein A n=1 Tax=Allonocardiopsis opalescens TaxID=1144618 RepID=A0A2T0Q489_9ACTN|nr:molybdenum cofactor guanylyltransferase [Allonocardiopsis opalescens]PRX98616.1 molybdopterin-guanine dinucleotide biosynthesis protein A [Allonocardiopsis opalescens]
MWGAEAAEAKFDAIILAGGQGRRMGGVDKPELRLGDHTLLERVAAAVSGADRLIVVGPYRSSPSHAIYVREEPPGAGPVPALAAGLTQVRAPWVAVLAADLPFLDPDAVTVLRRSAHGHAGALFTTPGRGGGRPHDQWLAGIWHTATLQLALAAYEGSSLHGLLRPLDPARVTDDDRPGSPTFDLDTPEDLGAARAFEK